MESADVQQDWIPFFEQCADRLLEFSNRRADLAEAFVEIKQNVGLQGYTDHYRNGTSGPVQDMCPFTVMNSFNLSIQVTPRRLEIAAAWKDFLGIAAPVPHSFEGVPSTEPRRQWAFTWANDRGDDEIDILWELFTKGIDFAEGAATESDLVAALDRGLTVHTWEVATGLYRARPMSFPPLDGFSRRYAQEIVEMDIPNAPGRRQAQDYVTLRGRLLQHFNEPESVITNFVEFSTKAFGVTQPEPPVPPVDPLPDLPDPPTPKPDDYTIDDIMAEGCFLDRSDLTAMLERLSTRRNLILQGPPGTGKSWLARRLAKILAGSSDPGLVHTVQFHPSTSYEDFVRGWRPEAAEGGGTLRLLDGPMLKLADRARRDPTQPYVMVIEEINRGNPAQALGEMLTLLEDSKRDEAEAIQLSYPRSDDERVHLPANFYVVGTMNIADRSLALVDLALRRRFAFVTLEPLLNERWRRHLENLGVGLTISNGIAQKLEALNGAISDDKSLGAQYAIGHSFVTPAQLVHDPDTWFRDVVETEIGPMLDEYWFDRPDRAREVRDGLLR